MGQSRRRYLTTPTTSLAALNVMTETQVKRMAVLVWRHRVYVLSFSSFPPTHLENITAELKNTSPPAARYGDPDLLASEFNAPRLESRLCPLSK